MKGREVFRFPFLEKPARVCATSRKNIHGVPGNSSKLAQFTPQQPQRTKFHNCDHHAGVAVAFSITKSGPWGIIKDAAK
ncbi:MAG: hypothetical protein P8X68_07555 [Desulfobacterales bacterium]|jgi:hypothetical protein